MADWAARFGSGVGFFLALVTLCFAAAGSDWLFLQPNLAKHQHVARGILTKGFSQPTYYVSLIVAVAFAWLMSEQHKENTVLVDLDLHFGTVGLKLDTDPGTGLCEALEQPSRIDALFVERAMIKLSDTLRMLAAEAALGETLMVDPGAIDVLLYELRRKFAWVLVDLPRSVNPTQRVVLGAATRVIILCERSLAGLRDTIRLQALIRENAPQARILLVDGGASGERATVGKSEFEKAVGKSLDATLSHDAKSAGAATNAGQPLPVAAPRSPVVREIEQLITTLAGAGETQKRKLFGFSLR